MELGEALYPLFYPSDYSCGWVCVLSQIKDTFLSSG